MKRIDAIYARQSVEKKDSISIDSQIQLCRRAADPDAAIYQDSGYSGKNIQRPEFSRMMEDIKAGKIKRVFCYRLDRISRSVYDFSLLWKTFDANGVEFSSITEAFDTHTPMGRAMVIIIMTFAQLERETIVSRYTTNRYARSNSGVWAGGKAPYGYRIVKAELSGKKQSVLEPVPQKLAVVSQMFSEYASGTHSLHSLAKKFNQNGVPSEGQSKRWSPQLVRRILVNPVYVCADVDIYSFYYSNTCMINDVHEFDGSHGCYLTVQGGKSSNGLRTLSLAYHEGSIPSDIFLTVQKSLHQNKQIKNGVRSRFTWLAGLLKCSGCGGRITSFQRKGITYFQCYRRFHSTGDCFTTIHGNASLYEAQAASAIQNKLNTLAVSHSIDLAPTEHVNALKIQLLENERQTQNLIEAIKLGGSSAMHAIQSELQKLETEHEEIMDEITAAQSESGIPKGLTIIHFAKLNDNGKRDIARILINRIIIGGDTPMQIIWK